MQKDVRSAVPRTSTRKKTIDESQEEDVRQKVVDLVIARTPSRYLNAGLRVPEACSPDLCARRGSGQGWTESNSTGDERTQCVSQVRKECLRMEKTSG